MDVGPLSKALIGKTVGFVEINKPQSYTQHYEVAAWWTQYQSDTGQFDITLVADHLYPENLSVSATLPATVTDSYNAPLFGGVPVGKSRDDRGQRGEFRFAAPWEKAVIESGGGSADVRWCVQPEFFDAAIEYAERHLFKYGSSFEDYWQTYLKEPHNQFDRNLGMVEHFGRNVAQWAKALEELRRRKRWFEENPKYVASNLRRGGRAGHPEW